MPGGDDIDLILDEFQSIEYDMEPEPGEHTGLCVIFNSCTFAANCLPTREGSGKDVSAIANVFGKHFGFKIEEMKDKKKTEMEACLTNVARCFNPAWRCFVCFFLSHGLGEEYLADVEGQRVDVRALVKLFDGEKCPKMVGKPKLFFAQMCRGFDREEYERMNRGYDASFDMLVPDSLPANVSPDRDRLMCYGTTEGRMALMDPEKGSLFIQTLAKVLLSLGDKKTIEEVLQVVTYNVDKKAEEQYKICPMFTSTLVGKLIFRVPPQEVSANLGDANGLQQLITRVAGTNIVA